MRLREIEKVEFFRCILTAGCVLEIIAIQQKRLPLIKRLGRTIPTVTKILRTIRKHPLGFLFVIAYLAFWNHHFLVGD